MPARRLGEGFLEEILLQCLREFIHRGLRRLFQFGLRDGLPAQLGHDGLYNRFLIDGLAVSRSTRSGLLHRILNLLLEGAVLGFKIAIHFQKLFVAREILVVPVLVFLDLDIAIGDFLFRFVHEAVVISLPQNSAAERLVLLEKLLRGLAVVLIANQGNEFCYGICHGLLPVACGSGYQPTNPLSE